MKIFISLYFIASYLISGSNGNIKLSDGKKTVQFTSMINRPTGTEGYIAPERLQNISGKSSTQDDQFADLFR